MRWLLAGCCALALINLSAAKHTELQIIQKPRFYGLKTNRMAGIHCSINQPFRSQPVTVDWYKADTHMRHNIAEVKGERIKLQNINYTQNASLYIYKTQVEDSGVYFCKFNNTWGPGTQLIVIRKYLGQHTVSVRPINTQCLVMLEICTVYFLTTHS
uniref:Ig-like domain-containing protein n=1 Tax=Lates calcarifer TaxID=8187 RepID=A0A4W6FTR0_LATCA